MRYASHQVPSLENVNPNSNPIDPDCCHCDDNIPTGQTLQSHTIKSRESSYRSECRFQATTLGDAFRVRLKG